VEWRQPWRQQVHDAQRRADDAQIAHGGEGLEQAGNREFAAMPIAQQQNIATAFMGFKVGLNKLISVDP
jgi:hypothetical protein